MLSPMLFFLEQLVMNETSPLYLRVYSWWMKVQNWATLRFSDHRGLNPGEVTFREGSFHARVTRSKTIGQVKTITSKPLVIDACCFFSHREWLTRGWSLLQGMANFPRLLLLALLLCLPWPGFALLPARPGRSWCRSVPVRSLGCSVFALLGLAFSCLRFSSFLARHMGVDE